MGHIRDFFHIISPRQNELKSDMKKSRICPICGQSDPLWDQNLTSLTWSISAQCGRLPLRLWVYSSRLSYKLNPFQPLSLFISTWLTFNKLYLTKYRRQLFRRYTKIFILIFNSVFLRSFREVQTRGISPIIRYMYVYNIMLIYFRPK